MRTTTVELTRELNTTTTEILEFVKNLQLKSEAELNWKANPEAWSILECLQHLNLYGNFYLPAIAHGIQFAKNQSVETFKSGLLGNYFAESMLPKSPLNKMKTFADKNPLNSHLDRKVLEEFVEQQDTLLDLLERSKKVNLNKVRVPISISRWIRLKLGDTFRFVIYHHLRHIRQIENILQAQAAASVLP